MSKIKYNKLVRDNIPKLISSDSKKCKIKQVYGEKKLNYLCQKLLEESEEFIETKTIEELADIQEVIYAVAKELKITPQELEETRLAKANARGSFDLGVVLLEVESRNK